MPGAGCRRRAAAVEVGESYARVHGADAARRVGRDAGGLEGVVVTACYLTVRFGFRRDLGRPLRGNAVPGDRSCGRPTESRCVPARGTPSAVAARGPYHRPRDACCVSGPAWHLHRESCPTPTSPPASRRSVDPRSPRSSSAAGRLRRPGRELDRGVGQRHARPPDVGGDLDPVGDVR